MQIAYARVPAYELAAANTRSLYLVAALIAALGAIPLAYQLGQSQAYADPLAAIEAAQRAQDAAPESCPKEGEASFSRIFACQNVQSWQRAVDWDLRQAVKDLEGVKAGREQIAATPY